MDKEEQEVREMTAQEKLNIVEAERKDLIEQVRKEKAYLKDNRVKIKAERDQKLKDVATALKGISQNIFAYNKLGMVEKSKTDILSRILNIAGGEDDGERNNSNQEDN